MECGCPTIMISALFFFPAFGTPTTDKGPRYPLQTEITAKFTKINCFTLDPKSIQNTKCWTKPINRTTTVMNFRTDIVRPLKSITINVQLNRRTNLVYRPFLVNITENYCDIFAKNRASAYMRFIGTLYTAHSNLNHTCPYSGILLIRYLKLDENRLQVLKAWPLGEYLLDVLAYGEGRDIIRLQFFFMTQMRHDGQVNGN